MKKFNQAQIDFIVDVYNYQFSDSVSDAVDRALTYNGDIEDYVGRFSSITDVLNGVYTMDDLINDVYKDIVVNNINDVVEEVYNNLTEEEQAEIDELAD